MGYKCLNVGHFLSGTSLLMFLMPIIFAVWKWHFSIYIWKDTYDGTAIPDAKTDATIKERKGKRGMNFSLVRYSFKNLKIVFLNYDFLSVSDLSKTL